MENNTEISDKELLIGKKWYEKKPSKEIAELNKLQLEKMRDDFVIEYLPYIPIKPIKKETMMKLLSYGWCLYNHKTIIIEQRLLNSYCSLVLSGNTIGYVPTNYMKRLSQVQIDECYHTMMSHIGIQRISSFRSINILGLKKIDIEVEIDNASELPRDEQELFLLAGCIVFESTFTKYLSVFSKNADIQPFCRKITELHRIDEGGHSNIFIEIYDIYRSALSEEKLRNLNSYINKIIHLATSGADREVWQQIYSRLSLGFTNEINDKYFSIYDFRKLCNAHPELNALKDNKRYA